MEKQKQLEGFFLSFTPEELLDIKNALEWNGYAPDGDGIKEALIDALFGDPENEPGVVSPTESFVKKAREFVEENPEKVKAGLDLATSVIRMMASKRRK